MEETFDIKNLKEQYPEILETIPSEIIDLASSEETQNTIAEICAENSIESEETIEKIAYYVGLSLFGELPQDKLAEKLTDKAGIERDVAEKIFSAADRLIFEKVRKPLDDLYKNKEQLDAETEEELDRLAEEQEEIETPETENQKPSKDSYREPVE